ncbi:fatty acid desaturase [Streptomyces sp. NPDC037389]|uniref:fatty acid desaturase n=1 Tax=Streptomyces sp. NPDC037389 TaxID=3155369 RepID=UPI0033C034EB
MDRTRLPPVARELLWPLLLLGPALPFLAGPAVAAGFGRYGWWAPQAAVVGAAVLEALVGADASGPRHSVHALLDRGPYHRAVLYAYVPVYFGALVWSCSRWAAPGLPIPDGLGLALAVGWAGGVAFTVSHELGHGRLRVERWAGRLLVAPFAYGHYYVEHGRVHHALVATPEDPSSARLGEGFWAFLPRVLAGRVRAGWRSEALRLARQGRGPWHVRNELFRSWAPTVVLYACLVAAFGSRPVPYLVVQAALALIVQESASYIQHYGLLRRAGPTGRHERPALRHSWNSNALVGNILLCNAPRHSHHHVAPGRHYQTLCHVDEALQLPAGYLSMIPLAWFPPLWRRVMDPKVVAHYGGDPARANVSPADKDVGYFESWAPTYDASMLQKRYFHPVRHVVLDHARSLATRPPSVLDIGCGTGALLRGARARFPDSALTGVDPAPSMVRIAHATGREHYVVGRAERLPFPDASFDLVLSTLSFHHWADQRQGLTEIHRVLRANGCAVIADHFAVGWLRPFFAVARKRGRMRTRREVEALLRASGLRPAGWHIAHTVPSFLRARPYRRTGPPLLPLTAVATAAKDPGRPAG